MALRSSIYVQDEFVIVATFFSQCRKIVVTSKLIMASNFLLIEVEGMITGILENWQKFSLLGAKSESGEVYLIVAAVQMWPLPILYLIVSNAFDFDLIEKR